MTWIPTTTGTTIYPPPKMREREDMVFYHVLSSNHCKVLYPYFLGRGMSPMGPTRLVTKPCIMK
jgi:hypothetical protein